MLLPPFLLLHSISHSSLSASDGSDAVPVCSFVCFDLVLVCIHGWNSTAERNANGGWNGGRVAERRQLANMNEQRTICTFFSYLILHSVLPGRSRLVPHAFLISLSIWASRVDLGTHFCLSPKRNIIIMVCSLLRNGSALRSLALR